MEINLVELIQLEIYFFGKLTNRSNFSSFFIKKNRANASKPYYTLFQYK